jgi:hypothetical protein
MTTNVLYSNAKKLVDSINAKQDINQTSINQVRSDLSQLISVISDLKAMAPRQMNLAKRNAILEFLLLTKKGTRVILDPSATE